MVVIGDLEFDGFPEFIYPSAYDGYLHCFTITDNVNEIYNWPFQVDNHENDGYYTFASEVTIVDIDNDGYAEIIFSTWTNETSGVNGELIILSYQGNVLQRITLPNTLGNSSTENYAHASPTIIKQTNQNIRILLNSAHDGVINYEIPNSMNAFIQWGTGRGNFLRDGKALFDFNGTSWGPTC